MRSPNQTISHVRRWAPALIGVSAVAIAGCGSSSHGAASGGSAAGDIQRAAYVSNRATGYRVAVHLQESASSLGGAVVGAGTGAFDIPRHAGSMTLNLTLPGALGALGPMSVREVLSGQNVYVRLPAIVASKLPGGKPWLQINLAQAGRAAGIQNLTSLMGGPGSTNPGQFLQYLRATAAGGVHRLGSQVVDGVSTTHDRATVDLLKVPQLAPAAQRTAMRQAISGLEKLTGLRTLPVDVWVDSHHLVRRLLLAYRATISAQSVSTRMRLDFLSSGPQPAPALPPAGQVTNFSALLSQLGGTGL